MAGTRGRFLVTAVVGLLALPSAAHAATIKVTTTADELDAMPDATCSLREAVEAARTNDLRGGCKAGEDSTDTITLGAHDYELTIPSTNEGGNVNGDLDMGGGGPFLIRGKGMADTGILTALADRVVDVGAGAKVTVQDLTLAGGDVTSFGTGSGRGGNIRPDHVGTVNLNRVRVESGDAFVGGGYYHAQGGKVTVKRSEFIGNHATGLAGALDVIIDVETTISKSRFEDNTVTDPTDSSVAGAISNRGSLMKITDTEVVGNSAEGAPNEAAWAGGISNSNPGEMIIRRSTIADNSASAPTGGFFEAAGGLYQSGGDLHVTNSTFWGNSAGSPGGDGGAIYANGYPATLEHVTFNDNDAPDDGDDVAGFQAGAQITLVNSILDGADPCDSVNSANFDSSGYNVAQVDDPACEFEQTDNVAAASFGFKTGIPAANGGSTDTIKITRSSPARNFVPIGNCAVAGAEDQRRYKRPKGKGCDSGSYEQGARPRR